MPLLAAGLYLNNYWVLGVVVVWLFVNSVLFPKPRSVDNWMSRGVLGEQIYYSDGKKFKKDLPTLLNILNAPVFVSFMYFGWQQELIPMILAGLLTMTIKFWFIDRMVCLTEQRDSI